MQEPPVLRHPLGFFQLDPVPNDEKLSRFYESEYYDLIRQGGRAQELGAFLRGGSEADDEIAWLKETLYLDCFDLIRETAIGSERVLDIGCGVGHLVEYLGELGVDSEGIEPSSDAARLAAQRGLNVHHATLEEWAAKTENAARYRAVTLLNVLEHVSDPVKFLVLAESVVKAGGVILFRVPNDFSEIQRVAEQVTTRKHWWVAIPDHINYFSPKSLASVCDAAGLELVDITADFPMEMFLMLGINYVDVPERGREAHRMRRTFELGVPKELRRRIYKALLSVGMGRNLLVIARRR